ncbi:TetR/AcrR family transcriptional regulator [Streptomyces zagrosensis]|uniref:AcrR family transcriptional regulator n=1 Tax=Streptomyces zagrosensis TaxID=1042984 RepID=A0A7W9Q8B7_9ACTN|nr:TetR/AcrR family transcriptional regulator [Streptomyces zagrosensis]MBB5935456.1 AcrR family transcriptional regulator [Streptomyces zagrosensis]
MGRREETRRRTFDEILTVANRVAEAEGWPAVTIRRIATEIGYSAPVIYQHFENKEAVLHTLLQQGNTELLQRLRGAVAGGTPAHGPHLAATAYLEFVRSQPALYQLMSGAASGAIIDAAARHRAAADVIAFTRHLIQTWAEQATVELVSVEDASDLLWGTLHGLAGIGTLADVGFDRAQQLADQAVAALLGYWSRA